MKKQNWRDYIKQDNPAAAALLSKMGYRKDERIQVKLEFLRMLVRLELDPARTKLLAGFFETYLRLEDTEEQVLQMELKKLGQNEEVRIMELTTSWERKGIMKGKIESIVLYLGARFGESSITAQEKAKLLTDVELLNKVSLDVFAAESVDEAQTIIEEAIIEQADKKPMQ
ncbi:hypothetical protein [Aneurinibacillus tyrosinisolvens]|uniref:hypothetical protein n=1 Tax=Aneurinibacillus tyrosinisolvens TaxID=1443435 RepID=UPI00128D8D82|nr:hypothetical protein [Aneurinibacillus tyrosinisolvens]